MRDALEVGEGKKQQATALIASISACLALFGPSSVGGVIEQRLIVGESAILLILAVLLGALNAFSVSRVALGLFIVSDLLIATALSPFKTYALGALTPYVLLATILSLDLPPKVACGRHSVIRMFELLSLVIQAFGLALVAGSHTGVNIVSDFYQAFDPDLFEEMIVWYHKPVTVFATHSVAGFAYFAFLLTHLKILRARGRRLERWYNAISVLDYVLLLSLLLSTTGFILLVAALAVIALRLFRMGYTRCKPIAITLAVLGAGALCYVAALVGPVVAEAVVKTLTFSEGGFLGRYVGGGRLHATYAYILAHPFQPVGITDSTAISFGDNFIAEYIIRGSILLYLAVLAGSAMFLRKNVLNRSTALGFFGFFVMSDIGYPLLPYYRAAGLLVFFILVWNQCEVTTPKRSRALSRSRMKLPGGPPQQAPFLSGES